MAAYYYYAIAHNDFRPRFVRAPILLAAPSSITSRDKLVIIADERIDPRWGPKSLLALGIEVESTPRMEQKSANHAMVRGGRPLLRNERAAAHTWTRSIVGLLSHQPRCLVISMEAPFASSTRTGKIG